ncbi:Os12g0462700, partial [Oryza sativa Japonica Group]
TAAGRGARRRQQRQRDPPSPVAAPSAARASPASPVALAWAGRGCCGGGNGGKGGGLWYNATVAGVISYSRIASLSGVSVQDLFLWFPVRGIHVDVPSSGPIYFDVGVVFKHWAGAR